MGGSDWGHPAERAQVRHQTTWLLGWPPPCWGGAALCCNDHQPAHSAMRRTTKTPLIPPSPAMTPGLHSYPPAPPPPRHAVHPGRTPCMRCGRWPTPPSPRMLGLGQATRLLPGLAQAGAAYPLAHLHLGSHQWPCSHPAGAGELQPKGGDGELRGPHQSCAHHR